MKAIIFPEPGKIIFGDADDPVCNDGEVIIKTDRSGICGTDLHIYRNEYQNHYPLIPGHEFCGEVVEIGKNVRTIQKGDRVAVDPNINCGECYFCKRRQFNQCVNWQGIGITRAGAFAEYVAVPKQSCYKLPEQINDDQAAFIEPLSCVIHALNRLQNKAGDEVLIFGAGPMGLLLIQALKSSAASYIVVVEKESKRRTLAKDCGASLVCDTIENVQETTMDLAPYGFAIVIDATGVNTVIEKTLSFLKPYGKYLQFGVAPPDTIVKWKPYNIFRYDLTILGSFALCYTFTQAISWLEAGRIEVEPLISHQIRLTDFAQTFQEFAEGKTLKVHCLYNK